MVDQLMKKMDELDIKSMSKNEGARWAVLDANEKELAARSAELEKKEKAVLEKEKAVEKEKKAKKKGGPRFSVPKTAKRYVTVVDMVVDSEQLSEVGE